jgi:hypothetical protein
MKRAILDILLSQYAWYRRQSGGEWVLIEEPDCSGWSTGFVCWMRRER